MTVNLKIADYSQPQDCADLVALLDAYARDPMGGGEPLTEFARSHLTQALKNVPGAFSILLYVEGEPAGLANCFQGFSTFKCKPLINIHDMTVQPKFRGLGLSQRLLSEVERVARERDCCKITLEVLAGNQVARQSYLKFGFSAYELDPATGEALFWEKTLP